MTSVSAPPDCISAQQLEQRLERDRRDIDTARDKRVSLCLFTAMVALLFVYCPSTVPPVFAYITAATSNPATHPFEFLVVLLAGTLYLGLVMYVVSPVERHTGDRVYRNRRAFAALILLLFGAFPLATPWTSETPPFKVLVALSAGALLLMTIMEWTMYSGSTAEQQRASRVEKGPVALDRARKGIK